jgi:hypothetical protein
MAWRLTRIGLLLLALGQGFAAVWALAAPRGFYGDFPGGGQHWVAALPPYNEHLVRDYGAAFLALSVLALAAAAIAERTLVRVTLAVWVVAALPHLVFHLAHASNGGTGSLVSLGLNAAVPLVLIPLVPKEPVR